jgi:hypothetical protein
VSAALAGRPRGCPASAVRPARLARAPGCTRHFARPAFAPARLPAGTGNQSTTRNTAVSLQISASDSASGQTLSYQASGLPRGLSINSATGLISGTPTRVATSTVKVTATDTTGATGSASFTWTVHR